MAAAAHVVASSLQSPEYGGAVPQPFVPCFGQGRSDVSTPTTLEEWLARSGLSRLAPTFQANGIGLDIVRCLTDDDLKELSLSIGDRKRVLAAIADLEPAAAPLPPPSEGERRQLTVLFCDLAGSTALAARLDPEDMRDLIRDYQSTCAATIANDGGFVAKYMGDGVLAYFGYPRAHEEDAERAVRAALDIAGGIGRLKTPEGVALQVRIGIATGLVVVGDMIGFGAAFEQSVVGETPNLAARLQALAGPDGIVIDEATRRQVGGLFELSDLGPQTLKGFADSPRVWQVTGVSRVTNRFRALRPADPAPLVGRDAEIELLMRHWSAAKAGHGRAVLISAEPGVGKSRLAEAIRDRIRGEPHVALRYFCSPHHRESALYPVIGQLERAAGLERSDDAATRIAKLAGMLAGSPVEAELPLLAELLSLPGIAERSPPLTPDQRKAKILDVLMELLDHTARRAPTLMIFEDLHWMDPTSGELTERALARLERMPVLMLATFRPDFQPPWTGRANVSTISLPRLDRRAQETLVRDLAGGVALPAPVVNTILDRSDGVPLFIEELTKEVMEAGGAAAPSALVTVPVTVPVSLQASLMARVDRLGPAAREVAQTASAIGREFPYDLAVAAMSGDEAQTRSGLDQLVAAGLVFQRGTPPDAFYQFKHALVRDVAYSRLLRGPRQALHGRIAGYLQSLTREQGDAEPEMLAWHFAEAAQPEQAASYWLEAGRREARRSANLEAIGHLRRGIAAVSSLEETPPRSRLELAHQLALGPCLLATRGYRSDELKAAYLRAWTIAERLCDERALFTAMWGHLLTRGQDGMDDETTGDLITRLFQGADAIGDTGLRLQAHHAAWVRTLWLGQPQATHDHVTTGLALYDRDRQAEHAVLYGGHDAAVCGHGHGAIALWNLGRPDQALTSARRGIALATDLGHAPSLAHALWLAGFVHQMRRDAPAALETAERLLALAGQHDFTVHRAAGRLLRGWARALLGAPESEGLAEMRAAVTAYRRLAGIMAGPYLVSLADSERRARHFDRAEATLRDAETVVMHRGEQIWIGGVLRSRGDVASSRPRPDLALAEGCYLQALAIARRVGAKSLELRAAKGLARVWHRQRKTKDARDLLGPVLAWFTEGFDTLDLIEAKAVLNRL
jgi:class 3 adenylate cyclase/predicted ATPase